MEKQRITEEKYGAVAQYIGEYNAGGWETEKMEDLQFAGRKQHNMSLGSMFFKVYYIRREIEKIDLRIFQRYNGTSPFFKGDISSNGCFPLPC